MKISPYVEYPVCFHSLDQDILFANWSGLVSFIINKVKNKYARHCKGYTEVVFFITGWS